MEKDIEITLQEIKNAKNNLKDIQLRSPLEKSDRLSKHYNAHIYLKREDLQKIRSFKIRGAYNKIKNLTSAQKTKGVMCASAGNHAQGVAFSCNRLEIQGTIYMPTVTPNQKINKVKSFGGKFVKVKIIGENFNEANSLALAECTENDRIYIHPFDDPNVIAGQGTIFLEILDQLGKSPDYLLTPVGGGGLAAGISVAAHLYNEKTKTIGIEADNQASMKAALESKHPVEIEHISSFIDGTAVKKAGNMPFDILQYTNTKIKTVDEGGVCHQMIELYQNEGIIAEPAGTLSIAGLEKVKEDIKNKTVVCIVSGGNNDLLRYPEILEKSLVWQGLRHYFLVKFTQKAGELKKFVNDALPKNSDIILFEYVKKNNKEKGAALVGVELNNSQDIIELETNMRKLKFSFEKLKTSDYAYNLLV